MPDMDPVDRLSLAQRLGQAVQAVTDHAEDALHTSLDQCFRDEIGDIIDRHDGLSFSRILKIDIRRRMRRRCDGAAGFLKVLAPDPLARVDRR